MKSTESNPFGIGIFEASFHDAQNQPAFETTTSPHRSSHYESLRNRFIKSKIRAVGFVALGCGLAAEAVWGGAGYSHGWEQTLSPRVTVDGSVLSTGTAEITNVDMNMPPITLATADTQVNGVVVGTSTKLNTIFGDVPLAENDITRKATVQTLIQIDPDKVETHFNAMTDQLNFTIPDGAISTSVDIPTGESSTVDKNGNGLTLSADMTLALTKAISGTFGAGGATKVPILGDLAKGTINGDAALEQMADQQIVTSVDQQCTPDIIKIPGFVSQLKENIKTVMIGQIQTPDKSNSQARASLSALDEKKQSVYRNIMSSATVTMSSDIKIAPDQGNIDAMNAYAKSHFFDINPDETKNLKCGPSKTVQLTKIDKGASR